MTTSQTTPVTKPTSPKELEELLLSVEACSDGDDWEEVEDENSRKKQALLSEIFGGRKSNCYMTVREFSIYASSKEDAESVKKQANEMGYKRAEIFVPLVVSPEDSRKAIPDPQHPYAVMINSSTSMIIGDSAKKFVELNAPAIAKVKDGVIFTYASGNKVSYTCNSDIEADNLMSALRKHYLHIVKVAAEKGQRIPEIKVTKDEGTYGSPRINLTAC